jgi:hypothetical protein
LTEKAGISMLLRGPAPSEETARWGAPAQAQQTRTTIKRGNLMPLVRFLVPGMIAVLLIGATGPASASAEPFFSVNGSAVTSATGGTFTSGTSHLKGKIAGIPVNITSTSDTGTFTLESGGKGKYTTDLTGNTVEDEETHEVFTTCTVEKTITASGTTQLIENGSKLKDELKGNNPPVLTEFTIAGASCVLKTSKARLEGTITALIDSENDQKTHDLTFGAADEDLTLDGEHSTLESAESLELNSGSSWSGLAITPFELKFSVAGTEVTSSTSGTFTSGTSHLKGKIDGIPINITSTLDTGTFTLGTEGQGKYTANFTGNTVEDEEVKEVLTNCKVEKTITASGTTELAERDSKLEDEFKGNSPPVLTAFSISGSSCPVKVSKAKLEGTISALIDSENDQKTHDLTFAAADEDLTFDGEPSTLESAESLELNSGLPWSALK